MAIQTPVSSYAAVAFTQTNIVLAILPLIQVTNEINSNVSAYLFFGDNSTTSSQSAINLSGLPTTPIPQDVASIHLESGDIYNSNQGVYTPPLASTLVCDPRMNITGGIVTVNTNGTLHVDSADLPSIGNIPLAAARIIFSQGLLGAVGATDIYGNGSTGINYIAAKIFMSDPSMDTSASPTGIRPLSLDTINSNINAAIGTAAKAYIDGYQPAGATSGNFLPIGNLSTMTVHATVQQPRVALMTSKPLWVMNIFLAGITMALLAMLTLGGDGGRYPFSLGNVLKIVQGASPEK
jgi:hypothetical protein